MTLKTMVNAVQDRVGLPRSNIVASSTDPNVRILLALANEEGQELAERHPWQALTKEQTFVSTATETQAAVIPSDLSRFVNESFFNRTTKRRVTGPLNSLEWQAQKSITASVLVDSFRVRGDAFLMTPVPDAGDTYAFEYISNQWCQSSGGAGQSAWVADDDTGKIPEQLMELGLIWRFRAAKELDYAEAFATYERRVTQAIMRDGARRTINFAFDDRILDNARVPVVPEGDWAL